MRITLRKNQGSAFIMSLIIGGLATVMLASYMKLIQNQAVTTMRSLSWNSGIPVAEAGIEDAMTHIHVCGTNLVSGNGWEWTPDSKYLRKQRTINGEQCDVLISASLPPVIVAEGKCRVPLRAEDRVSRIVRVKCTANEMFYKGMVAILNVKLNGNGITADSYDSKDPEFSTGGQYDETKRKDNGCIATNSGDPDMFSAGNANIWGKVATGPNGAISAGPNSCIGNNQWHDEDNKGIQEGAVQDDMNVFLFEVKCPIDTSSFGPDKNVTIGDTNYTYALQEDRDYVLPSTETFGGKVIVKGKARLLVTSGVSFSGSDVLYIAPGGSLELYVAAPSASIGGQGIQNDSGNCMNFIYYGLPTNTSLSYSGNGTMAGAIYAPNADFFVGGGGKTVYDFAGASVTRTITMNGHFNFHFDENLGRTGFFGGYVAGSWDEVRTSVADIVSGGFDLAQVQ